jgi:hypothetical protein
MCNYALAHCIVLKDSAQSMHAALSLKLGSMCVYMHAVTRRWPQHTGAVKTCQPLRFPRLAGLTRKQNSGAIMNRTEGLKSLTFLPRGLQAHVMLRQL